MKKRLVGSLCALAVLASGAALNATFPAPAAFAAEARSSDLIGTWSNPAVGVWSFSADGTGSISQSSNNGAPGQITTYFRWSVEPGNTLSYTPTRTALTGSAYDREEVFDSPKNYKQGFALEGDQLTMGGQTYNRR